MNSKYRNILKLKKKKKKKKIFKFFIDVFFE